MAFETNGSELDVAGRGNPKYKEEGGIQRGHVGGQFPHYKAATGACMCTDRCCLGAGGCLCRGCSGVGHEGCPGARIIASRQRAAAAETARKERAA